MKKKILFLVILIILITPLILYKMVLPSSFQMDVGGVYLASSGGNEVVGEQYYTFANPKSDGFLVSCTIENKKWVTDSSGYQEVCAPLARIATTRIGLIKQILTGELKKVKCEQRSANTLCYELK